MNKILIIVLNVQINYSGKTTLHIVIVKKDIIQLMKLVNVKNVNKIV